MPNVGFYHPEVPADLYLERWFRSSTKGHERARAVGAAGVSTLQSPRRGIR